MVECTEKNIMGMIRIITSGRSYSFVPASDIVVKCKSKCGFVGEWKVEQQQLETSISKKIT